MTKFLLGVLVGLVIVFGAGGFIAWRFFLTQPLASQVIVSNQPTPVPSLISSSKKIAYVKDNAIWLINSDGTGKKQLITQTDTTYHKPAFKSSNELSFIRCTLNCQLVTKNLTTGSEVLHTDEGNVLAFGWDHKGKSLMYITKPSEEEMHLVGVSGDMGGILKNFSLPNIGGGGRGGSLDDDISVQFSPDDKNILVVNTLTQPNNVDPSTIWVFDIKGKETLSLKSENGIWPTQATWINKDFVYKSGGSLNMHHKNGQISVMAAVNFDNSFNPIISDDGKWTVLFWTNPNSPSIKTITGSHADILSNVGDGFYKPLFLDNVHIIAIKTTPVPKDQESMLPFLSGGLSLINLDSKEVKDLDTGEIGDFAISP